MKPINEKILDRAMAAVESDENLGICLSCEREQEGVEPDARNYDCEFCGESQVFGAEEILIQFGF